MLAFTLERRLSKEDIFALYCNEIYLGQRGVVGVRGVDQAARVFTAQENKRYTDLAATGFGSVQNAQQAQSRNAGAQAAIARDTATALNIEVMIPSTCTTAKPRTGPEPSRNNAMPANMLVRLESRMVAQARS